MKTAVLCVDYNALAQHSEINTEKEGIYPVELENIPADAFHFIGRNICDTKDVSGVFHDIARKLPQILGYVTVMNENGEFLSYSRGASCGESRLNAFRSIGIGGHTDIEDIEFDNNGLIDAVKTLERATSRELTEEIGLLRTTNLTGTQLAISNLNDSASAVHVGIWIHVHVTSTMVHSTEETQDLKWLSKQELIDDIESYEPWSKLIIEKLKQSIA